MSKTTETKEYGQTLNFPSPASYMSFLLTAQEDPMFGPRTEIFHKHLSMPYIDLQTAREIAVNVRGKEKPIRRLQQMTIANGGEPQAYHSLPEEQFKPFSVTRLLRSVRLKPAPHQAQHATELLAAVYSADVKQLSEFLRFVWDLGVEGVEVAFLRRRDAEIPSYLVRIFGMRRADPFHAWCRNTTLRVEAYATSGRSGESSRFYTAWGYRFPVPGLEEFVAENRELVLLRPKSSGETQWMAFGKGEVNFFRKLYEFADLEMSLQEQPLVEMEEDGEASGGAHRAGLGPPSAQRSPQSLAVGQAD